LIIAEMQPELETRYLHNMKRLIVLTSLATFACSSSNGGSPTDPVIDPVGTNPRLTIEWDGHRVDWGAPERLVVTIANAPAGATVEWHSLDDFYLGQPVVLGTGSEITTAALKPGTTRVEAVLSSGGQEIARHGVSVAVDYRESWNVRLEGRLVLAAGTVGDVWVENDHAFVARRIAGGISVVALNGAPREVGRFNATGLFTQDVKVANGVAYVSHEGETHPNSVTIVDVSDPTQPTMLGAISRTEAAGAHNVWVDRSRLYIAAPREIHAYDVSTPAAPRPLGTLASTNGTPHDIHVRDGIVYGSYLGIREGEFSELVVATDADAGLVPLAFHTYQGAFTHSSWLTEDGQFLYVADEIINAPIRIYNVSNPAAPVLVATYQPRVGTIPHQLAIVDGERAYLAHYKHGVEVIDITDPLTPELIGFYDTFAGHQADPAGSANLLSLAHEKDDQSIYDGAWGVHWTADGRFVVSDMATGLFVFSYIPDS
jgi:hypothetical protein